MPQNARETIAIKIAQTLATVSLSPLVDASNVPLVVTVARTVAKISPVHLNGYLSQGSPEREEECPTGTEEWWLPFAVAVFILPTDDDPTAVDTYNNAVVAALHAAVTADYTQGDLAIDTKVLPDLAFPFVATSADQTGITFSFNVRYRTVLDDPFTLANG